MRPTNRNSAFTLVELLVVISIITLLIALLMPALGAARETARRQLCATQVRSINMAAQYYANESKFFLPGGCLDRPGDWNSLATTNGVILPGASILWDKGYVGADRIYMCCPCRYDRGAGEYTGVTTAMYYVLNKLWLKGSNDSSYGWAGSTLFTAQRSAIDPTYYNSAYFLRLDLQPSNYFLIYDGVYAEPTSNNGYTWLNQNNHFPGTAPSSRKLAAGGNVSYIDGSCKWIQNQGTGDWINANTSIWPDFFWPVGMIPANRASPHYFSVTGNIPSGPKVGVVVY